MDIQSFIPRVVTVAAGRFAPGHLGELTRLVPFELVDEALTATGTVQQRLRDLPSRVVVYLVLAGCLFPEQGYPGVWGKLTSALVGNVPTASPTAGALAQARRRVGPAPLRWLFDLVKGPVAAPQQRGCWWRGLLVCAVDGTAVTLPDSADMPTGGYRKQGDGRSGRGCTGYPQARLVALVVCGTRTLIDAVFGPMTRGETGYVPQLLPSLRAGMILLADRNFATNRLFSDIAATGAEVLVRVKDNRHLPVLQRHCDGSYLSVLGGLRVRVVAAEITVHTTAGRHTGVYRLVTSLLDPGRFPAAELIRLYHERWEIETTYLELKSSILGGRVLRARNPDGIEQEIYALLTVYHLLRTSIADAVTGRLDLDPDRASFSIAWHTARDQLVQAANIIAQSPIDLAGTIGRRILASLLPDRRLRVSPRIVKRAMSKYQAKGPTLDRASYQATLEITILAGPSP